MRRSPILLATSMCIAALLTLAGPGSIAFGGGSGSARRVSAILAGFRAQSLSWVSPQRGWMLGSAACGPTACTTVVGTTDGGTNWNAVGTIDAPLSMERESGATEIRFADELHGWAFDPALYATADGGATWNREAPPGGGHLVLALAGDSDAVYAVVSPCRLNRLCHLPATLWRATPGQGSWTQVSLTLPVTTQAVLAVSGPVAYLIVPVNSSDPDILMATADGVEWSSRPDPCVKARDEYLTSVAPISGTKVALLCVGDPGFSKANKRVLRSNDTGQTTRPAGSMPLDGIVSQLAAAADGTLVVASYSNGSWIYRNGGGRSWTTSASVADGGTGWNDVVFTTTRIGFVIHGPTAFFGGPGELWETVDGGLTWAPA